MKINSTSHPQLIGAFVSFLVIWQLHKFLVVNDCLNQDGTFEYKTGICFLANNEQYQSSLPDFAVGAYFIFAIVIAFLVAKVVRFLLNRNKSK